MTTATTTDDPLRGEGDRISALLGELEHSAGPTTWPRVQELVQRVVGLYGAGLERVLAAAVEAGAPPDRLTQELGADALVASLLVLHGLHPRSVRERVEEALDTVRPYLASHAGDVELLDVDDEGVVRLRWLGTCQGCPSSRITLEHAVERAIAEAAPEVTRVTVDGAVGVAP
jgi:Fe-S cluster biogenesis protein NfuA